jgi:hypothetical protein
MQGLILIERFRSSNQIDVAHEPRPKRRIFAARLEGRPPARSCWMRSGGRPNGEWTAPQIDRVARGRAERSEFYRKPQVVFKEQSALVHDRPCGATEAGAQGSGGLQTQPVWPAHLLRGRHQAVTGLPVADLCQLESLVGWQGVSSSIAYRMELIIRFNRRSSITMPFRTAISRQRRYHSSACRLSAEASGD